MPDQRHELHHKICYLRYRTPDTLLPLQVQSVAHVKRREPLDFLIVCVQSCSHFMIIKCLVFFNAYTSEKQVWDLQTETK